ncbi:hypothetical protein [Aliikangiella maris]|uniref:Uncharacterized protein n=2 Tax=Aliikangiella maris TaxID=3162458 RepID=A0ABV2BNN9_9GAMM
MERRLSKTLELNINPPDPNYGARAGVYMDRTSLITSFKNALSTPYHDCLLANSDSTDYFRILSPNQAIVKNPDSELTQTFITSIDKFFSHFSQTIAWQEQYGVAMYDEANWENEFSRQSNMTAESAKIYAEDHPEINFFFIVNEPMSLPKHGNFSPGDAVFFSGVAWPGSAPMADIYHKQRPALYLSSDRAYPYRASVTYVKQTDQQGDSHIYPVLQFNFAANAPINLGNAVCPPEGNGPYNIYYPFFTTNNPQGHTSFDEQALLPPPNWWFEKQNGGLLNPQESPSQMIFASSGIFSDGFWQLNTSVPTPQSRVLGNLQNQLDVAFNRGHAVSWFTLVGRISSSGDRDTTTGLFTSTVTLSQQTCTDQNKPNSTANLKVGMQVISFASNIPLKIKSIVDDRHFTVTSHHPIKAQNSLYLTFANFYPAGGTWNQYGKFFHESEISIDGRAYALSYDDQGGFSSTLTSNWSDSPSELTITLVSWFKELAVDSRLAWQNTGVKVIAGEPVTICYLTGQWNANPGLSHQLYGAEGNQKVAATQPGYPLTSVAEGSLIGRIGANGQPFYIGSGPTQTPSNEEGNLFLCINDDIHGEYGAGLNDNIGSISVQIIDYQSKQSH